MDRGVCCADFGRSHEVAQNFFSVACGGAPSRVAGWSHANRVTGSLTIQGHGWPRLPLFDAAKSDVELEAKLRQMDPNPDLTFSKRVKQIARSLEGPLELRAAACLDTMRRSAGDPRRAPRPCIDAITGEGHHVARRRHDGLDPQRSRDRATSHEIAISKGDFRSRYLPDFSCFKCSFAFAAIGEFGSSFKNASYSLIASLTRFAFA
jgi:hypothetical protein